MPTKLLYNTETGKLCGNTETLDACCFFKCDPCQMQMDLVVTNFGSAEVSPSQFCVQSNGTFRLRPTDTPSMPPAPGEACVTDPFTDFICFLESDPFQITEGLVTDTFRWAVRVAQHANLEDWVLTIAWYNDVQDMVLWWVTTVVAGSLEQINFCIDDFPCGNRNPPCDPFETRICGEGIETDQSRCDFQCAEQFQLTPNGIVNGTCEECDDLNALPLLLGVVLNPIIENCDVDGACFWGLSDLIEGAGVGCPDFLEAGISIAPVFGNGDGPPWNVYAFVRVQIDAAWHHVAWQRLNVDQLCCELDIEFTADEICDVSDPDQCDLTNTTLHLQAVAAVS